LKATIKYIVLIICILIASIPSWAQKDSAIQLYLLAKKNDSGLVQTKKIEAIQLYKINKLIDSNLVQTNKKVNPDSLISYAFSFSGKRYKRGGTTVNGFDCSGFTMVVFKQFGIKLPHTSAGQSFIGVEVPKKQISKGDLLFFRGANSKRKGIGHVGIVISNKGDPVQFIHSSSSAGVRVDRLEADYYKKRFMKATRVLF
jgi:cell wall-associated NlpC family hydrolase